MTTQNTVAGKAMTKVYAYETAWHATMPTVADYQLVVFRHTNWMIDSDIEASTCSMGRLVYILGTRCFTGNELNSVEDPVTRKKIHFVECKGKGQGQDPIVMAIHSKGSNTFALQDALKASRRIAEQVALLLKQTTNPKQYKNAVFTTLEFSIDGGVLVDSQRPNRKTGTGRAEQNKVVHIDLQVDLFGDGRFIPAKEALNLITPPNDETITRLVGSY